MLEKINETTEFLRSRGFIDPDAGIILGTGLGGLTAGMENCIEIDYREIPNFPVSTVEGHAATRRIGVLDVGQDDLARIHAVYPFPYARRAPARRACSRFWRNRVRS